jgi:hypothetical protein
LFKTLNYGGKGKEKIQVYDYKGNIIEIDTAADTIGILANSTINLNAININLLAKNAITATVIFIDFDLCRND